MESVANLTGRCLGYVLAVVLTLMCGAGVSAQQAVSYAPERLKLPDLVDDLTQCNLHLPADALVEAYARYANAYIAAYEQLDRELGASVANQNAGGTLQTLKQANRYAQEEKMAESRCATLLNGLLDDLQKAIPAPEQERFQAFRDECFVRTMMQRLMTDATSYRTEVPQDMGGWIRVGTNVSKLTPEARERLAVARLASSASRRAAAVELTHAHAASRLALARTADELGVGGKAQEEIYQMLGDTPTLRGQTPPLERLEAAARLSPEARAKAVKAQLDAWRTAAPNLPDAARRYAASTFVMVLTGQRGSLGNDHGLPASLSRYRYGGGLDVVRTALSLPELTDEQRAQLRTVSAEWLDARAVEMERLAELATRVDAPLTPDPAGMNAIDHKYRDKLATIAKADWLRADSSNDSTQTYSQPTNIPKPEPKGVPSPESLKLLPEDDILFPLARGGSSWYSSDRATDDYLSRRSGKILAPAPTMEEDVQHLLPQTEDVRQVAATICADFRADWANSVAPKCAELERASANSRSRGWSQDPEVRRKMHEQHLASARKTVEAYEAAWAAAEAALDGLIEKLAAVAPDGAKDGVRVWGAGQAIWLEYPAWGWELAPCNLPVAASTPWLSPEGKRKAAELLAAVIAQEVDLFRKVRQARHKAMRAVPAVEFTADDQGMTPGDKDPMEPFFRSAAEARDLYARMCKQHTEQIAAALHDADAAAWRSIVNAQRATFAYHHLRELYDALLDSPEHQAARAAVAAEQATLLRMGDRAFAILDGLPEHYVGDTGDNMHGPITHLHQRAEVYSELARDMRALALYRLKPLMPPEVVERVKLFRQVAAIEAVGRN